MKPALRVCCEVCGVQQKGKDWYLVTEDPGQDTLQILQWNSRLAEQAGMHHLCTIAHVEELVSHWMMTGSLEYGCSRNSSGREPLGAVAEDRDGSFRLGELMLDRASFAALGERPEMLNSILQAIDGALQAAASAQSPLEDDDDEEEEALVTYDA